MHRKISETSQLKISFQNHQFLHILVLSQTSESGCQGVWKFKNRYVCTFGSLGCVLSMVWSQNFFYVKVWSQTSIWKLSLVCGTSRKIFSAPSKSHSWVRNTQFSYPFATRFWRKVFEVSQKMCITHSTVWLWGCRENFLWGSTHQTKLSDTCLGSYICTEKRFVIIPCLERILSYQACKHSDFWIFILPGNPILKFE